MHEATLPDCSRVADRIVDAASVNDGRPWPPVVKGDWLKQALTDGLLDAGLTVEQLEKIEAAAMRQLERFWSRHRNERR